MQCQGGIERTFGEVTTRVGFSGMVTERPRHRRRDDHPTGLRRPPFPHAADPTTRTAPSSAVVIRIAGLIVASPLALAGVSDADCVSEAVRSSSNRWAHQAMS